MESVNEASKLVAQAIVILKAFNGQDWFEQIDDVIILLERSIGTLTGPNSK